MKIKGRSMSYRRRIDWGWYAELMKLSVIKSNIDIAIEDANANNFSYEGFYKDTLKRMWYTKV